MPQWLKIGSAYVARQISQPEDAGLHDISRDAFTHAITHNAWALSDGSDDAKFRIGVVGIELWLHSLDRKEDMMNIGRTMRGIEAHTAAMTGHRVPDEDLVGEPLLPLMPLFREVVLDAEKKAAAQAMEENRGS